MKKALSLIRALILLFTFVLTANSCNNDDGVAIRIGVMSGPTGMGMAKLISDQKGIEDRYIFKIFSDPQQATGELAAGNLDLLCLPTNTAATLANKTADYISVCAINTLGSLYLLTDGNTKINSINDLEGKTIYASVPNSTTKPIIDFILSQNGVNATVEHTPDHDTLVAKIKKGEVSIAVLPEPKVTAALANNTDYKIDLNLTEEWSKISDLPLTMGCIVVRNEYLKDNKKKVDAFLEEYSGSISYIANKTNLDTSAQMIVDAGILPQLGVAKKSLNNLAGSIVYIDGDAMKDALEGFYTAIGLQKPNSKFYYEK